MKSIVINMLACAALLLSFSPAMAQGDDLTRDELINLVGESVVQEAATSSEEVAKAKKIYEEMRAKKNATNAELTGAQMNLQQAQEREKRSEKNLDNAKIDNLAMQCGKTSDEIRAMRDSGMGWGRIAKECGGTGVGKAKGKNKGKNKGMDSEDDMSQGKGKEKKPKKK